MKNYGVSPVACVLTAAIAHGQTERDLAGVMRLSSPNCDFQDSGEAIDGFQVTPGFYCKKPATHYVPCDGVEDGRIYLCDEHIADAQECGHDLTGLTPLDERTTASNAVGAA